jgi:putative drug exporter of the RND superfamily
VSLTTESLARASSRRPWLTLDVWVLVIIAAGITSSRLLAGALTTDVAFTNQPEAKRAADLVEARFGNPGVSELFVIDSPTLTVDDGRFQAEVRALQAEAQDLAGEDLKSVVTFYDTKDPSLVSEDRHTTLVPVVFKEAEVLADYLPEVRELAESGSRAGDFRTQSFGAITIEDDFSTIAEEDLATGESFGIIVALIVLVIVFGAVVAGIVPIAMAIGAIAVATGVTALVGQLTDFSFFVTNMITMMGLAVGIDYSLFIVSRYREERQRGLAKLDAIGAAGATASRAVFFSGMTVVLALVGMLILPTTIFRSLAAGAIFVVVAAMVASLTLLPALLGLLGDRVNSLRIFRRKPAAGTEGSHVFWDRITHGVMRRPVVSLVVAAGLLIAASVSYFDMDTGFSGVSTLPDETRSKQAFEVLATEFAGGLNSPVETVVDGDVGAPEVEAAIQRFQGLLADDPMFGPARVQISEDGGAALISAPLTADPSSDAATATIERVREDYVPTAFGGVRAEVLVGGETAFSKDFFDLADQYTPIVFAFVLGLSFMLLTVVFRSIVVPIKAIILNLLSVGAAYGLIVLVFQKGVGADLLGFQQVDTIEAWLPLFLFSILFGLSMDYHVFLLSRIREHFDQTGDNTESVAYGLRTTGGLITGAAIIMVAVFGGFAAGHLVMLQQMGFGLAVAVLIDATIVRSVLVPASMKLLGNRNWYLPRWLRWLPDVKAEGPEGERAGTREPVLDPATEPTG